MAFNASGLNNIAGSMGLSNSWIYNTDDSQATVKAANYLNGAVMYELRDKDIMTVITPATTFQCKLTVAAGVVSTHAIDAY